MPYNFAADTFHTKKNFVADFLQAMCDFTPKTAISLQREPVDPEYLVGTTTEN